jgi:hypothetical protein
MTNDLITKLCNLLDPAKVPIETATKHVLQTSYGVTIHWLAECVGMHPSTVKRRTTGLQARYCRQNEPRSGTRSGLYRHGGNQGRQDHDAGGGPATDNRKGAPGSTTE